MSNQENNLKKELTFTDALGIAFGQIIGAGILALMGIAIGMTGKGVILAFLLSSCFTLITTFPMVMMSSVIPTTGAMYRYSSRLLSPQWGGFWMLMFVLTKVGLAIYALSFAQYFQGLVPGAPIMPVAAIMMTTFYITNLLGVKHAAVVEKWLVVLKMLGLGVLLIWGLPKIEYAAIAVGTDELFPAGASGFLTAVALVAFSTSGGQYVAELGGEMKNPARDIPRVIIISTLGSGIIYAFLALVATTLVPLEDVANKPLTEVARTILPKPVFIFFMIAGALTALATTLNAYFAWITKGLLIACQDGWLPQSLGAVSKRFGTPHWLLTIFYAVGIATITTGLSLATIAKMAMGLILFVNIIPVIAASQLSKKFPEEFRSNAVIKISPGMFQTIICGAVILLMAQGYFMVRDLSPGILSIIAGYMIFAVLYVKIRGGERSRQK